MILAQRYRGSWRFKIFFYIFNYGGHLVNWRGTILDILVEGHLSNISMKFQYILATGYWRSWPLKIFPFFALAANLFNGAEQI